MENLKNSVLKMVDTNYEIVWFCFCKIGLIMMMYQFFMQTNFEVLSLNLVVAALMMGLVLQDIFGFCVIKNFKISHNSTYLFFVICLNLFLVFGFEYLAKNLLVSFVIFLLSYLGVCFFVVGKNEGKN